jgi:hypothetical protein
MSETAISKTIRDALNAAGYWVIRLQASGRHGARSVASGEPGLPDLYLPGLGHIEVKTKGGTLSSAQKDWHARAARKGVNVGVARSAKEALELVKAWRVEARRA